MNTPDIPTVEDRPRHHKKHKESVRFVDGQFGDPPPDTPVWVSPFVEDPPGSGLYAAAMLEDPPGSGLYPISPAVWFEDPPGSGLYSMPTAGVT